MTATDRLFLRFGASLTDRLAVVLPMLTYVGIGLALPLALHMSVGRLVALNVAGTVLGWLVFVAWAGAQVQAAKRRHLLEWTSDLRLLDAEEFEWLVGEVLRRGDDFDEVIETGSQERGDGGIDLIAKRGHAKFLVQCKRWTSWRVGVDEVRKFAGTLAREKLPPSSGIFVTLSSFTADAEKEAKQLQIALIDSIELARRIEAVRKAECCPDCGAPMLLDRSVRGWWLRCPRWGDGCQGKQDLSRDAGRAVDFLLAD